MYDLKVVKSYSEALFANSINNGVEQKVLKQLMVCSKLFQEVGIFREIMTSPIVLNSDKDKIIRYLAKKLNLEQIVVRFFNILIKNIRFSLLSFITQQYKFLLEEAKGIKHVDVISASKLGNKEIAIIKQFLSKELNKIIKIKVIEDNTLIGGVVIKYDSKLLDLSVKGVISRIEKVARGVKV